MLYESILLYVDMEQPSFDHFHLSDSYPGNSDDEMVGVTVPQHCQLNIMAFFTGSLSCMPDENVANGTDNDVGDHNNTDYEDNDSNDYNKIGNTKKKSAKKTTTK